MRFLDVVKKGGWPAARHALVWLLLILFAGALPIGGSYLMIYSLGRSLDFREPLRHGELALFSISLLAGAVFVIARGSRLVGTPPAVGDPDEGDVGAVLSLLKSQSFPGLIVLIPLIFVEAIFAALLFAIAISADALTVSDPGLVDVRIMLTVILLIFGLGTAFVVTLLDEAQDMARIDYREMISQDRRRWQADVDQSWQEQDEDA